MAALSGDVATPPTGEFLRAINNGSQRFRTMAFSRLVCEPKVVVLIYFTKPHYFKCVSWLFGVWLFGFMAFGFWLLALSHGLVLSIVNMQTELYREGV